MSHHLYLVGFQANFLGIGLPLACFALLVRADGAYTLLFSRTIRPMTIFYSPSTRAMKSY